jgi:RNA polymerase sigma factor (sigma-70 family)
MGGTSRGWASGSDELTGGRSAPTECPAGATPDGCGERRAFGTRDRRRGTSVSVRPTEGAAPVVVEQGVCAGRDGAERGANSSWPSSLTVVSATNGRPADRSPTSELIERIASGRLGQALRGQVASWNPEVTRDELDEAFQEACTLAAEHCRGQTEGEVYTWLRTTTHRQLGDLRRRYRVDRELATDPAALELARSPETAPAPEEVVIEREDHAQVVELTRAALAPLSKDQRHVVALHTHGHRRKEIAGHLGITPRRVKRTLAESMTASREQLAELAGQGCESGEQLVTRLAFGLASEREARRAQLHLATCGRCSALYERLDRWRETVAALLPVPAVAHPQPGAVETVVDRIADTLASARQHGGETASAVRQHAADGAAQVKQHATAAYLRAADPTPLAGMRPGAAAGGIAACLAIGGGTTYYCVSQNVNPVGGITRAFTAPAENKQKPTRAEAHPRRTPTPTPTAISTPTPTPTSTPTPEPSKPPATPPPAQPTPQPTPTPEPTPPPAPEEEYEPTSAAAAAATPAPQAPRTSSGKPAPAPAGGPREFEP